MNEMVRVSLSGGEADEVLFTEADERLRAAGYVPLRMVVPSRSEGWPEEVALFGSAALEYYHSKLNHICYVVVTAQGQDSMRSSCPCVQHCRIIDEQKILPSIGGEDHG